VNIEYILGHTEENGNSNEEKALREIIELIDSHSLSFAELRGAVMEAILMLMNKPLKVSRNGG
jgi:hypothetical protein